MRRAVVIQVPLDGNGKPTLNLPEGTEVVKEDRYFHASWNGHTLSVWFVGNSPSGPVFVGTGTKSILTGLIHLGANVKLLKDVTAQEKTWLEARGVVWQNGYPVCPHVLSGDSPVAVGNDNLEEPLP